MKASRAPADSNRTSFVGLKKSCLLGGLVGIIAALCTIWTIRSAVRRPHLERCDLIEKGMTRSDVETVLGAPPGDYSTHEVVPLSSRILVPGDEVLAWTTDEGVVVVGLDVQGRVVGKEFERVSPEPSSSALRGLWMRLISWCTGKPRVRGGID